MGTSQVAVSKLLFLLKRSLFAPAEYAAQKGRQTGEATADDSDQATAYSRGRRMEAAGDPWS
jgi:hypothetical protein